jgi:general secretion pathway protein G
MKAARRSATLAPVVIGVTAILAFLLFAPKLTNHGSRGKSQITKIQVKEFEVALQLFRFDTNRYPTSEEGLSALIHRPGNLKSWKGPYLKHSEVPRDPWGRPFIYRCPPQNGTYDLICYGRDGAPGGEEEDEDIILLNREFPK